MYRPAAHPGAACWSRSPARSTPAIFYPLFPVRPRQRYPQTKAALFVRDGYIRMHTVLGSPFAARSRSLTALTMIFEGHARLLHHRACHDFKSPQLLHFLPAAATADLRSAVRLGRVHLPRANPTPGKASVESAMLGDVESFSARSRRLPPFRGFTDSASVHGL